MSDRCRGDTRPPIVLDAFAYGIEFKTELLSKEDLPRGRGIAYMNKSGSDESKFRMILLVAQRAKQIQAGAKPLVHTVARKATRIAREEFRAGLIPYEIIPVVVP